ncbi:MAG: hypothetical protein J5881_00700 [Clostridia bacterium]|nr:hypothetical protein [Clostridia bacterium]
MEKVLGYDCDGREIYEYRILRAIFSNDIDIEDLEDADPRMYCAVVANDGKAYAISVFDWWNKALIRKRENIKENEEIPIIIKSIDEMKNYELAMCDGGEKEFYYDFDRNKLKTQLNTALNKDKVINKNIGDDSYER